MNIRAIAAACGVAVMLALGVTARAAEVRVLGSNAAKPILEALVPQFEKATGNKVTLVYGTSQGLKEDIEKGVAFDLAVLTTAGIADLAKQGKVAASTQSGLARSGAGVAIKRGAAKPDIATTEAFRLSPNQITHSSAQTRPGTVSPSTIAGSKKALTILLRADRSPMTMANT